MHQLELGVPVAKILHLGLSTVKTVVTLAQATLLVLPLAVDDAPDRQNAYGNLTRQVDGVAIMVLWPVRLDVRP
jgi:hypothetical protein